MTTEPVCSSEAVSVTIQDNINVRVRLVDCVGSVEGA